MSYSAPDTVAPGTDVSASGSTNGGTAGDDRPSSGAVADEAGRKSSKSSAEEPVDEKPGGGYGVEVSRETARAVEAVVFAADEPVSASRVASVYAEVTGRDALTEDDVAAVVNILNERYARAGHAFRIHAWAGGYRMATVSEVAPYVRGLYEGATCARLSQSLLETLAVVAYRQPVTRPEIDFIRGVSADYAVRKLMEYGLVDVQGRSDSLGRPLLYGTTGRFLEQFGLNDLDTLPSLREVEELLDDPHFNRERAELLALKREAQADADGEVPVAMPDLVAPPEAEEASGAGAASEGVVGEAAGDEATRVSAVEAGGEGAGGQASSDENATSDHQ